MGYDDGSEAVIAILAIAAAGFQLAGYALYVRLFLQRRIRPNAASWLMFAYGTALMVALEWGDGARWPLLALPVCCALASIAVALLCLRKRATDAVDRVEASAFYADVFLSFLYAVIAFGYGDVGPFATGFVVAGNLTTLTTFFPVLRSTWRKRARELPGPWVLWTIAYALLTAVTLLADGGRNWSLLVYPVLSVALHAAVAVMALLGARLRRYVDKARTIYIAPSTVHGSGMFAASRFEAGAPIWQMTGRAVFGAVTSSGPNYIGLGPDVWIDPDLPLDHVNHRCRPNAAFGRRRTLRALSAIPAGEEILIDYSTTEADPAWVMRCACGDAQCRGKLRAIQLAFDTLPAASPLMQRVWARRREPSDVVPVAQPLPIPAVEPRVTAKRDRRLARWRGRTVDGQRRPAAAADHAEPRG